MNIKTISQNLKHACQANPWQAPKLSSPSVLLACISSIVKLRQELDARDRVALGQKTK